MPTMAAARSAPSITALTSRSNCRGRWDRLWIAGRDHQRPGGQCDHLSSRRPAHHRWRPVELPRRLSAGRSGHRHLLPDRRRRHLRPYINRSRDLLTMPIIRHRRQAGSSLIEVLIALGLVAVTMLGLLGLQLRSLGTQKDSLDRRAAAVLVGGFADRVSVNFNAFIAGEYDGRYGSDRRRSACAWDRHDLRHVGHLHRGERRGARLGSLPDRSPQPLARRSRLLVNRNRCADHGRMERSTPHRRRVGWCRRRRHRSDLQRGWIGQQQLPLLCSPGVAMSMMAKQCSSAAAR
jgi:hypothetical protein